MHAIISRVSINRKLFLLLSFSNHFQPFLPANEERITKSDPFRTSFYIIYNKQITFATIHYYKSSDMKY